MNVTIMPERYPIHLKKYLWALVGIWTVFIILVFLWSYKDHQRENTNMAYHYAATAFEKDIVYRKWAAHHQGVYVPISEATQPNPYLSHVEERDITTPSGRKLTLMNPAYITRQAHELRQEASNLSVHITSLNPVRPENTPDAWEEKALRAFQDGRDEISSIENINNVKFMRLIRPMITEKNCLKCHAEQGYKVGDIRGGISVQFPMAPLQKITKTHLIENCILFSMVWLFGIIAIFLGGKRLVGNIRHLEKADTALKKVHNDLELREQERDRILKLSKDLICIAGMDGYFKYVNPAWEASLGYTEKELLATPILDFIHPDDHKKNDTEVENLKAGKQTEGFGNRYIHKNGSIKNISWTVTPLREEKLMFCVGRDITEKKQAEEKMRESEERFKALFEGSLDCVYVTDLEGYFIDANLAALELTGYTREEIKDLNFASLLNEEHLSSAYELLEKMKTGEKMQQVTEYLIRRKDGTSLDIESMGSIIYRDGKPYALVGIARDITKRKKMEKEIRESEENFRLMVSEVKDYAIFMLDPDGKVASWNEGAQAIMGYKPEEVVGKHFSIFYKEKELHSGKLEENLKIAKENGRYEEEGWRIRKDGSTFMASVIITALRDSQDKLKGLSIVTRDITYNRMIEKDLSESQRQLQSILDNTTSVVYLKDLDGRYMLINRQFEILFHIKREEILGKTDFDIFPQDLAATFRTNDLKVIKAKMPLEMEEIAPHDDGLHTYISVKFPVLNDEGSPYGICGVSTDITDRKKAEDEIRKQRDRAQQYLDLAGVMFVAINTKGEVTLINQKGLEILGYDEDDVIGQNWFDKFLPERMTEEVKDVSNKILAGEVESVEQYKNSVLTKSGEERMIHWHNVDLKDESGKVIGHLSSGEDITERMKLEEQLNQAMKMEAIGRLAGGVAHDFNNALTPVLGISEMILAKLDSQDQLYSNISEIMSAGKRCAALTRQLLAFARRQTMQITTLNLNDVVTGVEKMLSRIIGEDIELIKNFDSDLKNIRADAGQIEQIIVNLAVNARDAMPDGGRLGIETRNIFIDAAFAKTYVSVIPGHYVLLSMSDTGSGMDEQTRLRIFDPFFTTKEEGKGTGLGLSSVYGIVKQSGGHAWVHSKLGTGTVFELCFPVAEEDLDKKTEIKERPATDALKGSETILLVEDDKGARKTAKMILSSSGYHVLEASNGQEAVKLSKQFKDTIHLIITDVIMPGMNGIEMGDLVSEFYPGIEIIYISGYADDVIQHNNLLDEGVNFLHKPFKVEDLLKITRDVLDRDKEKD